MPASGWQKAGNAQSGVRARGGSLYFGRREGQLCNLCNLRWAAQEPARRTRVEVREAEYPTQLRMIWPEHLLNALPRVQLPTDYLLRTYQSGDESRFFRVMELAGWPGWDDQRLQPWYERTVPEGWFMVVHRATGEVVGTAMALRDRLEFGCQGGEIGWVACVPEHRGQRLGFIVSAAATARLIEEGYRHIHLYTEDWRFAALKTYLKLGYIPYLHASDMAGRWQSVCARVGWPFAPEEWNAMKPKAAQHAA